MAALDGRGKIMTLNRENAKTIQTAYKSALFLRYLVVFLSDQASGRGAEGKGKSSGNLFGVREGREGKKRAQEFLL